MLKKQGILIFVTSLITVFSLTAWAERPAGLPDYYPAEYEQIIEASKKEGELLVYSNMAEYNWKPVIDGFNQLYPWIKVQTLDLGSSEVFERYYAEKASNSRTGDLMVSGAIDSWIDFVQNRKEALAYESPERAHLPEWSFPFPGLYTVSTDPMVIVYNKLLLPENLRPRGIGELAQFAKTNPNIFKGKITTYNAAAGSFGYSINWAFVREKGEEAWNWLETLGPLARPERSSGPMVEKLASGEYVVGFFISGIVIFPKMEQLGKVLGWNYIQDGSPLFMRGMAIPKSSAHPNSAKLMLDFILSHAGQVAFGKGRLTPYRPDVTTDEVPLTYKAVVDAIGGEQNVVLINYDAKMLGGYDAFIARWKKAFGLQ